MIALKAAIESPRAISPEDFSGKVPPSEEFVLETSNREIRIIPAREAITPRNFRMVNFSTPMKAPNIRVQTPEFVSLFILMLDMRAGLGTYRWLRLGWSCFLLLCIEGMPLRSNLPETGAVSSMT